MASPSEAVLLFFWATGCAHCEHAKPFVDALEKEQPRLRVERIEVRRDPEGRRRFIATMDRLGVGPAGVPTFVVGDASVIGYVAGDTDRAVRAIVRRALGEDERAEARARGVRVPLLGWIDPSSVPLVELSLAMGLVDGVNPCAIWVLVVLLGLLLHVEQRGRMLLYATAFILTSGLVYFAFMTAWTAIFQLVGLSRTATTALGGVLVIMGIVNLKEVLFFGRGPSLVIPARAKPALFRRMRAIAGAARVSIALTGVVALAFVVNLVELGCTIGLPAVFTRILSLRDLPPVSRYGYLALYNVAYVVPLFLVALAFVALRRRITMTERVARVLKGVSGALLLLFGVLFIAEPDALRRV